MYDAIYLSKYIIAKCACEKKPISNLQLQKILYYIQREYLHSNNIAFPDEIEAWQFGPVVPNVYYHYCGFGAMPITFPQSDIHILPSDKNIIDPIVESKRELDPWIMVEDTHKPGGAWNQIFNNGTGNRQTIPRSLIKAVG